MVRCSSPAPKGTFSDKIKARNALLAWLDAFPIMREWPPSQDAPGDTPPLSPEQLRGPVAAVMLLLQEWQGAQRAYLFSLQWDKDREAAEKQRALALCAWLGPFGEGLIRRHIKSSNSSAPPAELCDQYWRHVARQSFEEGSWIEFVLRTVEICSFPRLASATLTPPTKATQTTMPALGAGPRMCAIAAVAITTLIGASAASRF